MTPDEFRGIRIDIGFNQRMLAHKLGTAKSTIANYEQGKAEIKPYMAFAMFYMKKTRGDRYSIRNIKDGAFD